MGDRRKSGQHTHASSHTISYTSTHPLIHILIHSLTHLNTPAHTQCYTPQHTLAPLTHTHLNTPSHPSLINTSTRHPPPLRLLLRIIQWYKSTTKQHRGGLRLPPPPAGSSPCRLRARSEAFGRGIRRSAGVLHPRDRGGAAGAPTSVSDGRRDDDGVLPHVRERLPCCHVRWYHTYTTHDIFLLIPMLLIYTTYTIHTQYC